MTLGQLLSGLGTPPQPNTPYPPGPTNSNWIIILLVLAIIIGFGNSRLGFGGFGYFNFRYPNCRTCPVRHNCKQRHRKCTCKERPACRPYPIFANPIALIVGLILLACILQPKKCC